jgi:hypothetical protein
VQGADEREKAAEIVVFDIRKDAVCAECNALAEPPGKAPVIRGA